MAPSSRSSMAKPHTVKVPHRRRPFGKKARAQAIAPAVPSTVIAFGVSPARTSAWPIGSVTRETEARAKILSIGSSEAPGYEGRVGDGSLSTHRGEPDEQPGARVWGRRSSTD